MAVDDGKKAKSFADLGKLIGQKPAATATQQAQPRQTKGVNLISCNVTRQDRAGRASYNFVPLPDSVYWLDQPPPDLDHFDPELLSGEIDFEIEAKTDFFIRGMRSLADYARDPEAKQAQPFQVNGRLQIPGSSLRGMIRSLVEILGRAPLDPINDQQLFFRAVAAVPNPLNRTSFEPQAQAYKSRMVAADQVRDANAPRVMVGYLYGSRDAWTIRPAEMHSGGRQCFLVRERDSWRKVKGFRFILENSPGEAPKWAREAQPDEQGAIVGALVCSGPMQKKTHQWALMPEGRKAAASIAIPEADVVAYKEGGVTRDIKRKGFEFTPASQGEPCFYVQWTDARGNKRISFGHTHYFRLPYVNSTLDAIPVHLRRQAGEPRWDVGQVLFGRVPKKHQGTLIQGRKSRVAVEDGVWLGGPEQPVSLKEEQVVLGQPKPTTFQHYLVQANDSVADSITWDGNRDGRGDVVARGFKVYLHRPGAPLRTGDTKDNVSSLIRPARAGARFASRIRFQNLRDWELGALLASLELPAGCAHRLGMGKPLGLGSFGVSVRHVRLTDRKQRYGGGFLSSDEASLHTGASGLDTWHAFKDAFALAIGGTSTIQAYWETPRLQELAAALQLDNLPADWLDITRSLQFGQVQFSDGRAAIYNEYHHVGYPQQSRLEKRRPLPPATQVVTASPVVPRDPLPRFLPSPGRR